MMPVGLCWMTIEWPDSSGSFISSIDPKTGMFSVLRNGSWTPVFNVKVFENRSGLSIANRIRPYLTQTENGNSPVMEKISVDDPWIHIDPIGNKSVGDAFFINGTTNLEAGNLLGVEVDRATWTPGQKLQCGEHSLDGESGTFTSVIVFAEPPQRLGRFSVLVNSSHSFVDKYYWRPQEYTVTALAVASPVSSSLNFTLMPSPLFENVSYPTTTCG